MSKSQKCYDQNAYFSNLEQFERFYMDCVIFGYFKTLILTFFAYSDYKYS